VTGGPAVSWQNSEVFIEFSSQSEISEINCVTLLLSVASDVQAMNHTETTSL